MDCMNVNIEVNFVDVGSGVVLYFVLMTVATLKLYASATAMLYNIVVVLFDLMMFMNLLLGVYKKKNGLMNFNVMV